METANIETPSLTQSNDRRGRKTLGWYVVRRELTFYPASAAEIFDPPEYDRFVGSYW